MSRNACFYHSALSGHRQPRAACSSLFRRSKHQAKRSATHIVRASNLALVQSIENQQITEQMNVVATVAGAMQDTQRSTVLLGFNNLIQFLDWLDAEQAKRELSFQEE